MKILLLNFLFLLFNSISAITIKCRYIEGSLFWSESVYRCTVTSKDIFDGSRKTITGVEGTHKRNKWNSDVTGIEFNTITNLHLFPSGIENVFSNIIWIYIIRGNLREITKEDLKPFPQLKYLYMDKNNIRVLEPDLFINNPNLEIIWFRPNPIEHIDPHVFSNLHHLKRLLLGPCKDGPHFGDAHNQVNLNKMIRKVENEECTSFAYNYSQQSTSSSTKNPLIPVVDARINELNDLNLKLVKCEGNLAVSDLKLANYLTVADELAEIKLEKDLAEEKNEDLNEKVTSLTADVEKWKRKCEESEISANNFKTENEELTKINEDLGNKLIKFRYEIQSYMNYNGNVTILQ